MPANYKFVFVGGIHRSGTTPLARLLGSHPQISGLSNTGAIEDEGIYLQRVYPQLRELGGMGRFAHHREGHVTEDSPLATAEAGHSMFQSWAPYWDLSKPILVEKTPSNLVMGRFLQAVFPGSSLVVVVRHPVVVSLALDKWDPLVVSRNGRRRVGLPSQVGHWVKAHQILLADAPKLQRLHVLRYEELVADPTTVLAELQQFLGLAEPFSSNSVRRGQSTQYAERWEHMRTGNLLDRRRRNAIVSRYGEAIKEFGYDVESLGHLGPLPAILSRTD